VIRSPEEAGPTPVARLLDAAGRGDQRAWDELVARYRDLVRAITRSYRLQDADACDAEQRTWLRLVEHRGTVRDPERLGGWLATTTSRECLRILRERRAGAPVEVEAVPDPAGDVEERVVDALTVDRLWALVATLPPRSRLVMRALFGGEARPYAEVSAATGIPIGSLGPTRARVLEQLRSLHDGELVGAG
jgi:RNA polymerase sigma factor (sigma-70 family)